MDQIKQNIIKTIKILLQYNNISQKIPKNYFCPALPIAFIKRMHNKESKYNLQKKTCLVENFTQALINLNKASSCGLRHLVSLGINDGSLRN